ncbi:hypothetical protein CHARACLAT_001022, partial [Characodon lateralis]|nr:hypothetical protein [Characodon lateralis]
MVTVDSSVQLLNTEQTAVTSRDAEVRFSTSENLFSSFPSGFCVKSLDFFRRVGAEMLIKATSFERRARECVSLAASQQSGAVIQYSPVSALQFFCCVSQNVFP